MLNDLDAMTTLLHPQAQPWTQWPETEFPGRLLADSEDELEDEEFLDDEDEDDLEDEDDEFFDDDDEEIFDDEDEDDDLLDDEDDDDDL